MEPESRAQYFGAQSLRFERCFYPFGELCKDKAISAHSIQNGGVLASLAEAGFVVMPKPKLSVERPINTTWSRVGRNQATTFTGLCNQHDTLLFKAIDTKPLRLDDTEQLFLLAYRSVLRELHTLGWAATLLSKGYNNLAKRGKVDRSQPNAVGTTVVEHYLSAWGFFRYSCFYIEALAAENWPAIEHRIVHLDPPAGSFACSAVYSLLRGTPTVAQVKDPECAALNVFPFGDHTVAMFSYPVEHRETWQAEIDKYSDTAGTEQKKLISRLVLRHSENFVLTPSYFDSWSERKQGLVLAFFNATVLDKKTDVDDDDLMLF